MDYKKIITKVGRTFDPDKTISVTVVSDTDMGEGHFVVADINYNDDEVMRIPFVIFSETEIFMPRDWQSGELPETAADIETTEWVTYPNGHDAIIINGLPRLFVGDF